MHQNRTILVVNCGSSSLKMEAHLGDWPQWKECTGIAVIERIGSADSKIRVKKNGVEIYNDSTSIPSIEFGIELVLKIFREKKIFTDENLIGIGHRVVHGGLEAQEPTLFNDSVQEIIQKNSVFAPLHNPANLKGILCLKERYPQLPQVAVFDTSFHSRIPKVAYTYAIDKDLSQKEHLRRFGFHGSSHEYVMEYAANILRIPINEFSGVSLHLGNGASVCAIRNGQSIDTSMGFTPLEGLIMGTRSGDIDPGILLHLQKNNNFSAKELDNLLNKRSGLKGLCGTNDMRDILKRRDENDTDAILAFDIFCYRATKYLSSYLGICGEPKAIIFTAGIGENSSEVREKVICPLGFFNIEIDNNKNKNNQGDFFEISSQNSKIPIFVIHTDEEKLIAQKAAKVLHLGKDNGKHLR